MTRKQPPALAAASCVAAALVLVACDRPIAPRAAPPTAPQEQPAARRGPEGEAASTAARPKPASSLLAPRARPPSDEEITAGAAHALRADPDLAGADLSVSTTHGVVSLTGTVRSPEQLAAAEAHAQAPTGVMRVESHVSVNPG